MKRKCFHLPQTLRVCLGIAAFLPPLFIPTPACADQQNLLPALTDDTSWTLKKSGKANATLGHNDDGLVAQVTAVDTQPGHVEIDHSGVALAEGKIYLLSFEGRSDEAFALTVQAQSEPPKAHSIGLSQTVYLTPHWTPFRLTFTAHNVAPDHNTVPRFLLGRQTGTVYLRNASLVQLAAPPPADAGLPAATTPHAGETTLSGSLRSLLPGSRGFVMWVTGQTLPGGRAEPVEPPHLQAVIWPGAQISVTGKASARTALRPGDLLSITGRSDSAKDFRARQIQASHGYVPSPTAQ